MAALAALARILACSHPHYGAAPKISDYPERHPIKTMRELAEEMLPQLPPIDAKAATDWQQAAQRVLDRVHPLAPADAVRALDEEIAANRGQGYEARLANYLWDLRDLFSGPAKEASREEVNAYAQWRKDSLAQEKRGLPPSLSRFGLGEPPSWYLPDQKAAWLRERREKQAAFDAKRNAFDAFLSKASPALAPHWMVQRGAVSFRGGDLADAARWFSTVCVLFPKHARTETALFMLTRCRVEEARRQARKGDRLAPSFSEARLLLNTYATKYPKGRYSLDVIGWEGALSSLEERYFEAIGIYLRQLDDPRHPEHIASACREIERCLREALDQSPESRTDLLPVNEIAKRPIAAARVLGFLLDGAAVVDYERWPYNYDDNVVESVRRHLARSRDPQLLTQLAAAVGREQTPAQVEKWQPQLLAILAWAATENGDHEQAVRLCERSGALLTRSDDLQYCRGVALQRAGRMPEAAKALVTLRESFPHSRLTQELSLRIARILHHAKDDAAAQTELAGALKLEPSDPAETSESPLQTPRLHFHDELDQWSDVLDSLMPTEQLEKLQRAKTSEGKLSAQDCRELLMAYLTNRRWEEVERIAAELTAISAAKPKDDEGHASDLEGARRLTDEEFARTALTLADLYQQSPAAIDPKKMAELSWQIAQFWENHRGQLTLNQRRGSYMHDDWRDHELQLRVNAQALGFEPQATNRMLESRDELRRTYEHAMETASLMPRSPLAAQALHKALECLKRMAEVSPFGQARAFEADWGKQSRQIYDRLRAECPDSPEAQRLAAWWTFAAPSELHGWMPGSRVPFYQDECIAAAILGRANDESGRDWEQYNRRRELRAKSMSRIIALSDLAMKGQLDEVRAQSVAIRRDLQSFADEVEWFSLVSALDEIDLLVAKPPASFETLGSYLKRLFEGKGRITPAEGDEKDPLADFLFYRNKVTGGADAWSRVPWSAHEAHWRAFLESFPQSLKREAAEFQLARSIVRQHRGWVHAVYYDWPEAPFEESYIRMDVQREAPFDARRATEALDAYEKAYPIGRYAADIRFLRGGVAVDTGDYASALRLLCATLDDSAHRELHADAARNLAQCFELLHDPEKRLPLARAIAANEAARKRFHLFTRSPTCGQRLRVVEDYVGAVGKQIGP